MAFTLGQLARRSLRHHARSHIGVFLGALVAAAILIGALCVGDSVRFSLRQLALRRLGQVHLALVNPGRFFRESLADAIAKETGAPVAAVALLTGTASATPASGDAAPVRVGPVQVVGVDPRFFALGGVAQDRLPTLKATDGSDGVALSERLARALGAGVGDEVLLRVSKPSLLSRDAPLSTIEDASVALRLPVTAIIGPEAFSHFGLDANQSAPLNAFVDRRVVLKAIGMEGRANVLLAGPGVAAEAATRALWKHWEFSDAGLTLRTLDRPRAVELRTERVFLDPPVAEAAFKAAPGAKGALTYFVNALEAGGRATPYSVVAAMEGGPVPAGLGEGEILLNRWLADDLGVGPGAVVNLRYWVVGPLRKLEERTAPFTVKAVLPLDGPARDPALLPDIPGLSDKKDCREWEPGVPIDLEKIRDKDQAYWSAYRGTPKAFLTLRAGQKLWDNRFGNLTAIRWPLPAGGDPAGERARLEACLRQALSPASLGLFFVPVRARALEAAAPTLDFGQLFLGFSLFLIVAAVLLTALLFALNVERRAAELGTLRALGFSPGRVRLLLLTEGAALAALAALLGALVATRYTRAVIDGLSGVWKGAVAEAALTFHAEPTTLVGGACLSFSVAVGALFLALRRQSTLPVRVLLAEGGEGLTPASAGRPGLRTLVVAGMLAVPLVGWGATAHGEAAAGAFFGAGAALLVAGLGASRLLLARLDRSATVLSPTRLSLRNAARRAGRSLSAIALLASGTFLVIAIGANRHDPGEGATQRSAGTGGFALFGESALPVHHDLNAPEGQEHYNLDGSALEGTTLVPLRLREGDEASCLNLNRARTPRLVGVDPAALGGRFTFTQTLSGPLDKGWDQLAQPQPDGAIPVIGDTNTVVWALGLGLGKTLDYVDGRGVSHRLRIVGVLANSVLQGALVVAEPTFVRLFPGESGFRVFLIDAPAARARQAAGALSEGLEDVGFTALAAPERLAAFATVENTYLAIFATLGGFGLLLGSAGLGVVVARNVVERRRELAALRALGWQSSEAWRSIVVEHALLLGLGLTVGVVAAAIAVAPSLRGAAAQAPWASLGLTLALVAVNGLVWTALAAAAALRIAPGEALRD